MSTVFFQVASPWHVVLTLPHIRKADQILFFHRAPFKEPAPPTWRERTAVRLARLINHSAPVVEIDREGLYRLGYYQNNFECDRDVDVAFDRVERSASFGLMSWLIGDDAITLFYKQRLLDQVRTRTAFLRAIPAVMGSGGGVAVPAGRDPFDLKRRFFSPAEYAGLVPPLVRVLHLARAGAARLLRGLLCWNLLLLAGLPLGHLAALVGRRGLTLRTPLFRADVIAPLISGFALNGLVRGRRRHDDGRLLGGELGADRVAFFYADWAFGPEERSVQDGLMQSRGIRRFDLRTLVPSLAYLRAVAGLCLRLWGGLCRRLPILWEEPAILRMSALLLYHYLRELLFVHAVEYKVAVEYRDYLSTHVVRTIVANQHGRLTVGIHHNAPDGPWGFPVIRYAHINRYCLWGEEFKRLYAPHWDRLQTCPVGPLRVDDVAEALRGDRLRELRLVHAQRFGGIRPLIVLLFPGRSAINVPSRIEAHFEGLRRLREMAEEFLVICRFRNAVDLEHFRAQGLDTIMAGDPRIHVDMTELTTYEWFALSDVVIVNGVSTGMIEAAAAGKPCFSFDHLMLAETVYGRYGRDLILREAEDLVRVVKQVRQGFIGWDCRWDQLAKDYCYFADGRNLDRFRRVILDALAEVEGRRLREETAG
jgi:hypothetical protein